MNTPAEFLHLQVESVGNVSVVRMLAEDLGAQAAIEPVSRELYRLAESEPEQNILLDFSGVTLISSIMLARLIQMQDMLTASGGKLVLCNQQASVYQVFAVTRLTKTFVIKAGRAEGLAMF